MTVGLLLRQTLHRIRDRRGRGATVAQTGDHAGAIDGGLAGPRAQDQERVLAQERVPRDLLAAWERARAAATGSSLGVSIRRPLASCC